MKFIREQLGRRTFVQSVAILAGGTVLSQGLVVIVSPLLTRLYTPEDFGLFAVFVSLFSLLLSINSLRYELAIPLPKDEDSAINLFVLVLVLVGLTTLLFLVLFWLFGDWIVQLVGVPELKPYLGILAFSLLAGGIYQGLNFLAVRRESFRVIAQSKVGQSLGLVATQIILGFAQVGTGGLTLGVLIGQIGGNPPFIIKLNWREIVQKCSFSRMLEEAQRYRRFPIYTSWASFLNTAGLYLPAILVTSVYSAETAGWFSLGQRVISLPVVLIGVSVGQVYLSRASQVAKESPHQLPHFYHKTLRSLLLIGILPISFLAVVAPLVFTWVFGPEWRTAGEYIQLLTPLMLAQFAVSPVAQNIYIIERQDIQSTWDVVRLATILATFALAAYYQLSPQTALLLYSSSGTLAYIILYFMNRHALKKFVQAQQLV
jgi:O-antigen/teichoic acid export membrane protein